MEYDIFKKQVPEKALRAVVKSVAHNVEQLDKHVRALSAGKIYSPETTHQTRIMTRKCTMACQVLYHAGAKIECDKARKSLRSLRRSLGDLRDADIRMAMFQDFSSKRKAGSDDALSGSLQCAWLQCYQEAAVSLRKEGPGYLETLASMRKHCKGLSRFVSKHRWTKRDSRWVSKQLVKWSSLTGKLPDQEKPLHAVRIKTKRVRYLLQCLLPGKMPAVLQKELELLEELQSVLGKRRDLQNVVAWLKRLQDGLAHRPEKKSRLVVSMNAWLKQCEKEIRRHDIALGKLRKQLAVKSKREKKAKK